MGENERDRTPHRVCMGNDLGNIDVLKSCFKGSKERRKAETGTFSQMMKRRQLMERISQLRVKEYKIY